jgi:RNA polymerase sigma-70 factor (ECF subfamily)
LTTSDAELLEQAGQYDNQALAEIYDRYAGSIYGYLYRYLGDAAQAEDLTSEVFLRLLRALNTRRAPRERLQGWLYRVAHNLAMDWFRQQARTLSVTLNEEMSSGDDLPAATLEKRLAQEQLRAGIRKLTADQQQVILLRFGEGFKVAEVARLMGKSVGAVKILQHRAVKRLRRVMEESEVGL